MFYQTQNAVYSKCSKCNKIDDSEILHEFRLNGDQEEIRRCKNCGHRKLISTLSRTVHETTLSISISMEMYRLPDVSLF